MDALSALKKPTFYKCAECLKLGDSWVHLRSSNQHASKHIAVSNHSIIIWAMNYLCNPKKLN